MTLILCQKSDVYHWNEGGMKLFLDQMLFRHEMNQMLFRHYEMMKFDDGDKFLSD